MRADAFRRLMLGGLAVAVLLAAGATDALAKKPWEKFDFPTLGEVQIPDYDRHVLDNGLVVYLLQDNKWPLVEGQVMVRTGAAFEPAPKVGLASVTGNVLRTGGTETVSSDELDQELESMGAYIESSIGNTQGTLSFSFLTQHADRGFDLLADVLRRPAFEQDKIDVALEGERAGVARRNDDLNGIASRELRQAIWGDDHPYARDTEYATLDAITRDDVVGFYEYFYHPDNMMIAVWGDIDTEDMLAALEERFGDWPRGDVTVPDFPNDPNGRTEKRVLVANKDDVNQTRVVMGHIGMRADDEDYFAMSVANRILGGSFGDRLFNEVRTKYGYAYNVGSTTGAGFSTPGVFQAYVGTKSSSTEAATEAVLNTIETMRAEPVSDEELSDAKEGMLAADVFNYVTPQQVLQRKMSLDYLGYPEDFLETYNDKVQAIEKDDVLDVMQRRVRPDEFAIVAVGKTEEWDGDMSRFGPVEELDISIPEPAGPEFPDPTDETVEKGRAILAKAQTTHGGQALTGMESMAQTLKMNMSVQGMSVALDIEQKTIYPDRTYRAVSTPFGDQTMGLNEDGAWMAAQGQIQDMGAEAAADQRRDLMSDPLYLLANYDQFPVQQLPSEDVDGAAADVVLVWIDDEAGEWIKLYFDPSGVLVRSESKGEHPMTQVSGIFRTDYADVKAVDGVMVPHTMVTEFQGETLFEGSVESMEINPSIDGSVFQKPAS